MTTPFEDLTLAEVDEISRVVLGGKSLGDETIDSFMLAGGIMWMLRKREEPALTWNDFKNATKVAAIKAFSIDMEAAELDPTRGP